MPGAGDGFVQLNEVNFETLQGSALFGNKDALLAEWRRKLGFSTTYDL